MVTQELDVKCLLQEGDNLKFLNNGSIFARTLACESTFF